MIKKHYNKPFTADYSLVENYEKAIKDDENIYVCHHRLETHFSDGTERPPRAHIKVEELVSLDMYYNRPPEELIFLTMSEHSKLHNKRLSCDENFKHKRSELTKGKKNPMYGKHLSESVKRKISKANKGRTSSFKGKSFGPDHGKKSHPEGWSEKVSKALMGHHNSRGLLWFNNGLVNTRDKECPEGFIPGKLKKK